MAESLTIARPYAEAAFGLARDTNTLQSWSEALARLAAVAAAPEVSRLLGNPKLTEAQIASLVADGAAPLTNEQRNFAHVLAGNERLSVLPEIAAYFETLRNGFEGVLDAQVSSAYPLTDAQVADIVAALEGKFGKKVKASVAVDPELIGGVSIRVGDEVIDASVRGKLAQLAGALQA